jgi:hypothetical protein
MTHAADPNFVLAVLALSLPDDAPSIPLESRCMRRAWRAAYVRVTAERPNPRSSER